MAKRGDWFEVDCNGLGKVLARKGIEFALGELIQNAWDADGVTTVAVTLEPVEHSPTARLTVTDDAPGGFADLAHSYRLFGGSTKGKDPTKRGKFDIGEKLVFALAREASVETTTGTVTFGPKGRRINHKATRERGSVVRALLPMTREGLSRCEDFIRRLLPPETVATSYNGVPIPSRVPDHTVNVHLDTEVADEDGRLRRSWRFTDVRVHRVPAGGKGYLYEMGLPVQEVPDPWSYDVQQRVPVGFDRDSVSEYYLGCVRSAVLEATQGKVADASHEWVDRALAHRTLPNEVVREVVRRRFGEKAVASDPTDPEAVHRATAAGYVVVSGGSLSASVWERVREADALPRAGRVFPTPRTKNGDDCEIPEDQWTLGMRNVAAYCRRLGNALWGWEPSVMFINQPKASVMAVWVSDLKQIRFNVGCLGEAFFPSSGMSDEVVSLVVHEFGHHYGANHLSENYYNGLTTIAAKIRKLGHLDYGV